MPNFMIVRFQTSEITWNKQTDTQTDRQTDKANYYVDYRALNAMKGAPFRSGSVRGGGTVIQNREIVELG